MAPSPLILLVVLLVATTATATRRVRNFDDIKVAVDVVCSQTKNPDFCNGVLHAIPGVEQQSLETVSSSILDQEFVKATEVYNKVSSMFLHAPDAQVGPLNFCLAQYNFAVEDNGKARNCLRDKEYVKLNKIAGKIANYANKCEGSFKYSPENPSPITQENSDFFNLVDVLSATSHLLLGTNNH